MQTSGKPKTTLNRLAEDIAVRCVEKLAMKSRNRPWEDYAEDIEPIILAGLKEASCPTKP